MGASCCDDSPVSGIWQNVTSRRDLGGHLDINDM